MPLSRTPAPAITRRGFLWLAGATASLAALARLRVRPALAAQVGTASAFFSPREQEILAQIAARMVASDPPDAPHVRDTATVATIDALCASLDPAITAPLPALLHVVDYAPLVFDLAPRRFTGMTPEQQDASLAGWMRSRFAFRRQAFLALRNLSFIGYYSQEECWPLIGYAGPLLRRTPESA